MNTHRILTVTALLVMGHLHLGHGALIIDFGSGFTVDGGVTDFTSVSQTSSSINLMGNDNQTLAGTFGSFDLTGFTTLVLVGSISGTNPNTQFSVDLFNNDFTQTQTYSGFFSGFGSSPTAVTLSFVSQTAAFSEIAGFQIDGDGSGDSLNLTFTEFNAIPEPSSLALLGLALAGIFAWRRRKAVSN